jgi:hypothetical protein
LVIQDKWYCYDDFMDGSTHTETVTVYDPPRHIGQPSPCADVQVYIDSVFYSSLLRWQIVGKKKTFFYQP